MVNREYVQLAAYYLKIVVCMKSLKWKRACHGYLEETKVRYSFFLKKNNYNRENLCVFFFFFFFPHISGIAVKSVPKKQKDTLKSE